jgi:hypothetical protein
MSDADTKKIQTDDGERFQAIDGTSGNNGS